MKQEMAKDRGVLMLLVALLFFHSAHANDSVLQHKLATMAECVTLRQRENIDKRRRFVEPYRRKMRAVCTWCTLMDPDLSGPDEQPTPEAMQREFEIHARSESGQTLSADEAAYLKQRKEELASRDKPEYKDILREEEELRALRKTLGYLSMFPIENEKFRTATEATRYLVKRPKLDTEQDLHNFVALLQGTELPRLKRAAEDMERKLAEASRGLPKPSVVIPEHNKKQVEDWTKPWLPPTPSPDGESAISEVKRQMVLDRDIGRISEFLRGKNQDLGYLLNCPTEAAKPANPPPASSHQ